VHGDLAVGRQKAGGVLLIAVSPSLTGSQAAVPSTLQSSTFLHSSSSSSSSRIFILRQLPHRLQERVTAVRNRRNRHWMYRGISLHRSKPEAYVVHMCHLADKLPIIQEDRKSFCRTAVGL